MLKQAYCSLFILSYLKCYPGILNAQEQSGEKFNPIADVGFAPDAGICILPASLGFTGTEKLVEDCESLELFKDFPPVDIGHYGSAIIICCPQSKHTIVFPIDEESMPGADYEYMEGDLDYLDDGGFFTERPEVAKCPLNEDCVSAFQCSELEDRAAPPQTCGWDSNSKNYAVCCQKKDAPRLNINIRTTSANKYKCDDYVPECKTWASKFPSSCSNYSDSSFDFMVKACMHSCNICEDRGCVDEFDKCQDWARSGHCVDSADFMAINCRASCGICGFSSIRNNEEQIVNGRDYSNLESPQFYCGRSKLKNSSDVPVEETTTSGNGDTDEIDLINAIFSRRRKRDLPELKDTGEFFYYHTEAENSKRKIICASTIVADRFVVSAAHCYINFQGSSLRRIHSVILRDDSNHTEQIEMRRIFIYPYFQLPSLYDDIAVIELGRRVKFDYDTYGDSPACLGTETDTFVGQEAISQGYGFTENKVTSDYLLETTNNIIDNADCADYLSHNSSRHINYQTRLKRALSSGINDQLICTMGQRNVTSGVYSGPCEGDSGGPLYVKRDEKNTLVGIVSGGLGCGLNIPKWYTRISTYLPWIKCIITNAKKYKSQARVEFFCQQFLRNFPPKNLLFS